MGLGSRIPNGCFCNFGGAALCGFRVFSQTSPLTIELLKLNFYHHWIHFGCISARVIKAQIHHFVVRQNIFVFKQIAIELAFK